jgi:hypothetical protein
MVIVSDEASEGVSFTLKRIVDVGNNKPADMYSRSLAADTGPVKPPAALKYCKNKVQLMRQNRLEKSAYTPFFRVQVQIVFNAQTKLLLQPATIDVQTAGARADRWKPTKFRPAKTSERVWLRSRIASSTPTTPTTSSCIGGTAAGLKDIVKGESANCKHASG